MERDKIIKTIKELFTGVDERHWRQAQNVMADKVTLDFESMTKEPPKEQTPKEVTDTWNAFLPGFDKIHHKLSDFKIDQTGNHAIAVYKGKADHFIGKDLWRVEGTYETELIRKNSDWKIAKHKFKFLRQRGNASLLEKAREIIIHKRTND